MSKQFATLILRNEANEVVLILREDFHIWGWPGGGVEIGETPENAAIRETREETGFEAEIVRYCGQYQRLPMNDTRHVYLGRVVGGEAIENGPETLAVGWFKPDQLPAKTTPFVKEILQDALSVHAVPFKRIQRYPLSLYAVLRVRIFLRDLRNRWNGRP